MFFEFNLISPIKLKLPISLRALGGVLPFVAGVSVTLFTFDTIKYYLKINPKDKKGLQSVILAVYEDNYTIIQVSKKINSYINLDEFVKSSDKETLIDDIEFKKVDKFFVLFDYGEFIGEEIREFENFYIYKDYYDNQKISKYRKFIQNLANYSFDNSFLLDFSKVVNSLNKPLLKTIDKKEILQNLYYYIQTKKDKNTNLSILFKAMQNPNLSDRVVYNVYYNILAVLQNEDFYKLFYIYEDLPLLEPLDNKTEIDTQIVDDIYKFLFENYSDEKYEFIVMWASLYKANEYNTLSHSIEFIQKCFPKDKNYTPILEIIHNAMIKSMDFQGFDIEKFDYLLEDILKFNHKTISKRAARDKFNKHFIKKGDTYILKFLQNL